MVNANCRRCQNTGSATGSPLPLAQTVTSGGRIKISRLIRSPRARVPRIVPRTMAFRVSGPLAHPAGQLSPCAEWLHGRSLLGAIGHVSANPPQRMPGCGQRDRVRKREDRVGRLDARYERAAGCEHFHGVGERTGYLVPSQGALSYTVEVLTPGGALVASGET